MPPSSAAMENSRTRSRVLKTLRESVVQQTRLLRCVVSSSGMLAMVQGVTYSVFATAGEQLHIVPPCWRTLFTGPSAVQWTESEGCFGNMLKAAAVGATTLWCHHLSTVMPRALLTPFCQAVGDATSLRAWHWHKQKNLKYGSGEGGVWLCFTFSIRGNKKPPLQEVFISTLSLQSKDLQEQSFTRLE